MSGTKQNQVWPCRPVNWYAGWPGQAPVKHGRTVLGSSKHVHLDACAAFPVRSSLSFYSSSRNCLVGTRVEPVVYVHNRHLQLRGNAAILIKPFSFFTSFKSELKQKIYILDWEMCRSSSVDPLGGHSQVVAYTSCHTKVLIREEKQKQNNKPCCILQSPLFWNRPCGLFSPAFVAQCLCVNKCINPWRPGETVLFALLLRKTVFDPYSNSRFKTEIDWLIDWLEQLPVTETN